MEKHLKILGVLFVIRGVLSILGGMALILILGSISLLVHNLQAAAIITTVGAVLGAIFMVTGIPEIAAGWGLLIRKRWGRILGIIMGILNIFDVPLGTALGVYSLWVLFNDEAEKLLT
ncbi:conserved membrane hypothetical protein [Candidatus Zixiibacteriota bacterium]|nr:conserved membrane hypothetical protein [candidate division Zixibacteria bacterium]